MNKILTAPARTISITLLIFSLLIITIEANADIRLPSILSSNMVLQRNEEIKIWGWADKGESVSVLFNSILKTTKTGKDGKWAVTFPTMKEGGPYDILIQGKNSSFILENILIGDIWVCGGQSNMNWSVLNSKNHEEEIRNANYPMIRLLSIPRNVELSPKVDVPETEWKICSPENISDFSAVGYFFGREIFKQTNVPVGLINSNWGGTVVEAWISYDFMIPFEEYSEKLKLLNTVTPEEIRNAENHRIRMLENEFGIHKGKIPEENWADTDTDLTYWKKLPGIWESRGLNGVDGVIWFRNTFILPVNAFNNNFTLSLGKINNSDIVWINGIEIGRTDNNDDLSSSIEIKQGILNPGNNVIVVKVEVKGVMEGLPEPQVKWKLPEKI